MVVLFVKKLLTIPGVSFALDKVTIARLVMQMIASPHCLVINHWYSSTALKHH